MNPFIIGILLVGGAALLRGAADFLRGEASENEREYHTELKEQLDEEYKRQRKNRELFEVEMDKIAQQFEKEGMNRGEAMRKARLELLQKSKWKTEQVIRENQFDHFISAAKGRQNQFQNQLYHFETEKNNLYSLRREHRNDSSQLRRHSLDKMLYEFEEAIEKMKSYINYLERYVWKMQKAKATNKDLFLFELTLPIDYPYAGKLMYATREELLEEFVFSSEFIDYTIVLSKEDINTVLDYEIGKPVPICLIRPNGRGGRWTASLGYGYYKEHLENAQYAGMEVSVVRNTRYETIVQYHGIELSLPLNELIQPLDRKPQPQMLLTVYPFQVDYYFFTGKRLPRVTERFFNGLNSLQLDEIALAIPDEEATISFMQNLSTTFKLSSREWKIAPHNTEDNRYRVQLGTEIAFLVERIDDKGKIPLYFLFIRPLMESERIKANDVFVVSEFTFHVKEEVEWLNSLIEEKRLEQTLHLKLFLDSEFRKQRLIQKGVATRLYYNKWTDLMEKLSLEEGRLGPFSGNAIFLRETYDSHIKRLKVELSFEYSEELLQFLDGPQAVFRHRQHMVMDHPRYGERVAAMYEDEIIVLLNQNETMLEEDLENFKLYYVGRSYAEHQQFHAVSSFRRGDMASSVLHEMLLDPTQIVMEKPVKIETEDYFNSNIAKNSRQREIVEAALGSETLYMIQGPPGSGKTTIIQEIVRQHLKKYPHDRVLITSQSNVAVDNVLADFMSHYPDELVRCGNEDKMQRELVDFSFEEIKRKYRAMIAEKQVSVEIESLLTDWKEELDKEDSSTIATLILQSKQIVGATCVGLARRRIGIDRLQFDLVIVDEAGRALPGEMLLPLIRAKKAILIGDHLQLPPTLPRALLDKEGLLADEEQEIKDELIGKSLFERLYEQVPAHAKNRLGTQYRMPADLGKLVSTLFYEGDLESGKTTELKRAQYFPHVMTWLDLGDETDYKESEKPLCNDYEAKIVLKILQQLNISDTVGVITPYRAQKRLLYRYIRQSPLLQNACDVGRLKVDTIDGFQGEESDVIFYCTTRAIKKTSFFSDAARLNVALSRTKREILIVGSHRYFKRYDKENPARQIAEYIEREGVLITKQKLFDYLEIE